MWNTSRPRSAAVDVLGQADEGHAPLLKAGDGLEEVAQGQAESVEPPHNEAATVVDPHRRMAVRPAPWNRQADEVMARVAVPALLGCASTRLGDAVWDALGTSPGYAALAGLLEEVVGAHGRHALQAPFALGEPGRLRELFTLAELDVVITTHGGAARFASLAEWLGTEVRGWTLADSVDDATMQRLEASAHERLARFVRPDGSVTFAVSVVLAAADAVTIRPGPQRASGSTAAELQGQGWADRR